MIFWFSVINIILFILLFLLYYIIKSKTIILSNLAFIEFDVIPYCYFLFNLFLFLWRWNRDNAIIFTLFNQFLLLLWLFATAIVQNYLWIWWFIKHHNTWILRSVKLVNLQRYFFIWWFWLKYLLTCISCQISYFYILLTLILL